MPRTGKGPRLYFRRDQGVWIIRDGTRQVRTGCIESDVRGAEKALQRYISGKHEPAGSSRPDEVTLVDVLLLYARDRKATLARPRELGYHIDALTPFWGLRKVSEIRGETCRAYVKRRTTPSMARHELETLRAAVNHYHAEMGLDVVPKFTLPEKGAPRERWLTRSEVARLLQVCRRSKRLRHIARVILIGVYTGTRCGAILKLQWMPNTTGGYVDLEKGVMYRRAPSAKRTKKRQPPVRIPSKLLGHMKRWHKLDRSDTSEKRVSHLIHYNARPVVQLRNSWPTVRKAAGLGNDVVIHSLRHTAATWRMLNGADMWQTAGFLGMTYKTLEETYGHHHVDYQKDAAEAL